MAARLALALTVAGRRQNYVLATIASLRSAGFTEPIHLFAEPDAPDASLEPNTVCHRNAEQLGCYRNWKQALTWMVGHVEADWLFLLQDDVVWRSDAAARMYRAIGDPALGDVGFLSPYTSRAMLPRFCRPADGWHDARFPNWAYWGIRSFWGALALCLPRASAVALRDCPLFEHHRHTRKLDEVVGRAFRKLRKRCLVHVPSLADHAGMVSTIGRDRIKRNQWGRRGYQFRPAP